MEPKVSAALHAAIEQNVPYCSPEDDIYFSPVRDQGRFLVSQANGGSTAVSTDEFFAREMDDDHEGVPLLLEAEEKDFAFFGAAYLEKSANGLHRIGHRDAEVSVSNGRFEVLKMAMKYRGLAVSYDHLVDSLHVSKESLRKHATGLEDGLQEFPFGIKKETGFGMRVVRRLSPWFHDYPESIDALDAEDFDISIENMFDQGRLPTEVFKRFEVRRWMGRVSVIHGQEDGYDKRSEEWLDVVTKQDPMTQFIEDNKAL